jgi:hypothetical protein
MEWLVSGLLRRVVWWKFTDVSEVLPASAANVLELLGASINRTIILMLGATSAYEMSVKFYQTTRPNAPEDNHHSIKHDRKIKRQNKLLTKPTSCHSDTGVLCYNHSL